VIAAHTRESVTLLDRTIGGLANRVKQPGPGTHARKLLRRLAFVGARAREGCLLISKRAILGRGTDDGGHVGRNSEYWLRITRISECRVLNQNAQVKPICGSNMKVRGAW
jgi:hypothetical protein